MLENRLETNYNAGDCKILTIIECHFGGFDEQNNPAFQSTQIFGG